jgi:LPS-assembly protein
MGIRPCTYGIAGLVACVYLFLIGLAVAASALDEFSSTAADSQFDAALSEEGGKPPGQEPWNIEALSLIFYHDTDVVIGEGAVRVWRGDLDVSADRMVYNRQAAKVWASGSVVIHFGQDVLTGTEGTLDLRTYTGTMDQAHLFLQRNNVHLLAKHIEKTGPEEYVAKDATVSTCPLPKQAWSFSCRDLELTIGGMAVATHSTFDIRKIPVLYSPWLAVPINRFRKTGFLLPHFSQSSRNGWEITVPFFWVINDSMDATFYQQPIGRRGWMEGEEFRYVFSPETKGIVRHNFLLDTLEDNDFNDDGDVRGNEKRWWLRAKADQSLPLGFEAKLDVDTISDRDYLEEFDDGPMGYGQTNKTFLREFGRSLAEETDPVRPSTLQITRVGADSFAGGAGVWNDHLIVGQQDATVQTLPALTLHGFKQRVFKTPLYYDWDTSYVYYWRETGIREQRLHVQPRVSMPVNLHGWADLLLSGTVEESIYDINGNDPEQSPTSNENRLLYNLEADLSTTVGRNFHLAGDRTLRHSIRPRVTFTHRPSVDQDDLPEIDRLDRLEATNRITWSLLSFLSSKMPVSTGRFAYSDLLRMRIEQSYDTEGIEDRFGEARFLEETRTQKFSDVYGEIEFRPLSFLYLRYDTTYSVEGEGFTTYNFLAHLSSSAGDHLDLDYRYGRLTDINEFNADLRLVFSDSWFGTYHLRRSLEESSELESAYGLRYQSSCWAVECGYKKDRDDTRFSCYVELLGIGGWGRLD